MKTSIANNADKSPSGTSLRNIAVLLLAAAFACALPGAAGAASLHDTGQTKCYQTADPWGEIPCYGTGQDGEYTSTPFSYTATADTVTDNNTGLIWQRQNDNATHTESQAVTQCAGLPLGGFTWRLPSIQELMSIADYSRLDPAPALNTTYFLPASQNTFTYWSSTQIANDVNSAWYVYFLDGSNGNVEKINGYYYVRCVRGATPAYGTFVSNGNGTVTDTATGLMWQWDDVNNTTWGEALSQCKTLPLASRKWRLPNIRELTTMVNYGKISPAMDTTIFSTATSPQSYWSSTSDTNSPSNAWIAYVYIVGSIFSDPKTNLYWTKCVTCAALPVWIDTTASYYSAVQSGYSHMTAGQTLKIQSQPFSEGTGAGLILTGAGAVTLKGGYNCDYSSNHGFSTISPKVTIGASTTITVENIIIR
jgi:hypothetical protein